MLLSFSLLMFVCESTGESHTTTWTTNNASTKIHFSSSPPVEEKPSLQLVAIPDYPVAAGRRVNLQCRAFTVQDSVGLSWQRLRNQTWLPAGVGGHLTLTEPEQSGLYRCLTAAESRFSQNHTVYIVATHTTVGENLGTSAFVFSLLALIAIFAIIFWLCWHRLDGTLITGNVASKGFPGSEQPPKEDLPHAECDVYVNYTCTSSDYTDLNPTTVIEDDVYSNLS
uniref:uncharacterized protein LOC120833161 isoform X1 n=1 Tax=Gasterosteus aculeatus aculeatus TaxID=481459 RepID=UPI001A98467E|nr:uncharacterized protein LOC120833161 isoform X1 [Gasterosteus aculeatus aculeatus]